MAAPHASGVAGLARDAQLGQSAARIAALVIRESENLGDRSAFGHGMVDAAAATQKRTGLGATRRQRDAD